MINTQKGDLISISTLLLNYSSISILLSLCQHFSSSTTMTNTDRKQLFFQRSTLLYLSFYLIISVTCSDPSYTPPDNIAINCGGHGDSVSLDGRKWTGDISSKFISSQQQQLNASSTSTASTQDFAPQIPYTTARIFHSQFTYTVPVSIAGPKFIRLHFHPASYSSLNISTAFFYISVDKYTLVHNFSTSLTAGYLNTTYFVKEFCINMVSEQSLNITFSPSPGGFAFVNGIEVVSMPANLYINGNKDVPLVGQSQTFIVDNTTALEMIYRLNVDGQAISPADDTGMFRAWSQDIDYIYGGATGQDPYHFTINISYTKVPPYTAPEILYRTARSMGMEAIVNEHYNLTWLFPVDSGFYYLVRLHFCEIAPEITGANQRVFEIFLNNQTADDQMDIMTYAGGIGVPIYRDFILMVPGTGSKEDLWLALHPNTGSRPKYPDALLKRSRNLQAEQKRRISRWT
ncbi:hypothetical protein L1049_006560 [Liquidambar formosana]|uniref:Malectin-like domain-containing protein n=1 Tax=Liquidambar formosana TaxID=63359 RepID=A0AAP0RIL8_LIQFO